MTGSWACLELPDTAISCVRWDTTATPLLSLASVMFWWLTEETGGGGGKVRKDFGNFPSTSEIVLQQHKPTVNWFPVHLGCVSQAGNTLNRRWKAAHLKQPEAHGSNHNLEVSPVLSSPEPLLQKRTALCWLSAVPDPSAHSGLKG